MLYCVQVAIRYEVIPRFWYTLINCLMYSHIWVILFILSCKESTRELSAGRKRTCALLCITRKTSEVVSVDSTTKFSESSIFQLMSASCIHKNLNSLTGTAFVIWSRLQLSFSLKKTTKKQKHSHLVIPNHILSWIYSFVFR